MRVHVVLLLFYGTILTSCRPVRDRFVWNDDLSKPRRCIFSSSAHTNGINSLGESLSVESDMVTRRMAILNCSVREDNWAGLGKLVNATSYDGVAGIIQRGEVDGAFCLFRSDFFDSVIPGYFSSTIYAADVQIISRKNESRTETLALLELWTSQFDSVTVDYLIICLYLFVATLSFVDMRMSRFSILTYIKAFARNIFDSAFAIFDQENFDPCTRPAKIAILAFNIFLLFAIHGVMLGSMGSDMVTDITPPVIQSVWEFSNTSYMQPVIFGQFYLPPVLRRSLPRTELRHLKEIIDAHPENSFSADLLDRNNMLTKTVQLIEDTFNSKKAMLLPIFTAGLFRKIGCTVRPDILQHLALSQDTLAHGTFSAVYSKNVDWVVRKTVDYLLATGVETGIGAVMLERVVSRSMTTMLSNDIVPFGLKWKECMDGAPMKPHDTVPLDMKTFGPIFKGMAYALSSICFIFVMEKIMHFRYSKRRRIRRRIPSPATHLRMVRRKQTSHPRQINIAVSPK